MPTGLDVAAQTTFSGGAFQVPSRDLIPANAAFSITNGLLQTDGADGSVTRRGGSIVKAATLGASAIKMLWDGFLYGGARTCYGSAAGLGVMDAGDTSGTLVSTEALGALRPAAGNGELAVAMDNNNVLVYGGARRTSTVTGTTAAVVIDSTAVTGTGTTWVSQATRGDLVVIAGTTVGIVDAVVSNTALTLARPATAAFSGAWSLQNTAIVTTSTYGALAAVATVGNPARLCHAHGGRIYFTESGDFFKSQATDFHQLPQGAQVLGMESLRNILFVFSTQGVFTISHMDFDLTDAAGNVQHSMEQINRDVILWDQRGIAGARNSLVVPGVDDVYFITDAAVPQVLSQPVSRLYRQYVAAGYSCGGATVFRGHYMLPILNGNVWVDTLVFRFDGGGWTQWSGDAATTSWCVTRGTAAAAVRQPELLAVYGTRMQDLTGTFAPTATNKNDADGSSFPLEVVTRDFTTGGLRPNLVKKVRLGYELTDAAADAPTISASYATGPDTASFVALSGAAAVTDGPATRMWEMGAVRPRFIRFKFRSTSPAARMVIKSLEIFVRSGWRQ